MTTDTRSESPSSARGSSRGRGEDHEARSGSRADEARSGPRADEARSAPREADPPPRESGREAEASPSQQDSGATEPSPRKSFLATAVGSLPFVLAGILLIVYFVWLLSEMSTAAAGGAAVPAAIFGGVLLGILGGGAGVLFTRSRP
jgi:hypothetical protein